MKVELGFLRSKIARRMFLLFILAAMLPMALAGVLAYDRIVDVLTRQSYGQLQEVSKGYGNRLIERLHFGEIHGRELGGLLAADESFHEHAPAASAVFSSVTLGTETWQDERRAGGQRFDSDEIGRLESGESVLSVRLDSGNASVTLHCLIGVGADRRRLSLDFDQTYLWGDRDIFPYGVDVFVVDEDGRTLFKTAREVLPGAVWTKVGGTVVGTSTWTRGYEEALFAHWRIFMAAAFGKAGWTVMARQPKAVALAPLSSFQALVPPLAALAAVLGALLSLIYIRRRLKPVERLIEGTRRIAGQRFEEPVEVGTDDEFTELADAFNNMAGRLGRQFRTLETMAQVDRMILSTASLEPVLENVLERVRTMQRCKAVSVTLIDRDATLMGRTFIADEKTGLRISRAGVSPDAIAQLESERDGMVFEDTGQMPEYLGPLHKLGCGTFLALPAYTKDKVAAILAFAWNEDPSLHESDRSNARALADRFSVALAHVEREKQLFLQAHYDPLTGLPNRQLFTDRLHREIEGARLGAKTVAVLFVDLDRFKNVNDSLGHPSGDTLLKMAAERLSSCVRRVDTVARLGGDEFTVILAEVSNLMEVSHTAERIVEAFKPPFKLGGIETFVTASVGIAIFPDDGNTVETLLQHADTAMYAAKADGRSTARFFEGEMNVVARQRLTLEAALRQALARDELVLHYQPQFDMGTRRITGVEALVRWARPEHGLTYPADFIPVAEDSGLITAIGQWTLATACRQFSEWRLQGIAPDRMAVNLSTRQFRHAGLPAYVHSLLQKHGLPRGALELEITETMLVDDVEGAAGVIREFRRAGVRMSLDDFGTGYSSLAYLRRFPIDSLKIDRSFLEDVQAEDDRGAALIRSIITMAHVLGIEVVAEGVETEGQLAFLLRAGCDLAQGFCLSKPLPAADLSELLVRHEAVATGTADP